MTPRFSVGDFIAVTNQAFENIYPAVEIEGEVASFKVNQGKYVFFDLKDAEGSVNCFMMVYQLRVPIEDGMKVVVSAAPKLTQWGKFSLTVKSVQPSGEGSLKKSFELLKAKLAQEGLFALERKRPLPQLPEKIAVISSMQAAGYADFVKIINDRWGGLDVQVANVTVQGSEAPDQIIRALRYFNTTDDQPEIIVIIRGGGSADDLSAFNDELLVREIAASRVPVITGIGHEVDESLSDLAADVQASTPSNVAQIIVPDKREIIANVRATVSEILPSVEAFVARLKDRVQGALDRNIELAESRVKYTEENYTRLKKMLYELSPDRVLERGYALLRGGDLNVGSIVSIETAGNIIKARIESNERK
ncbi:exodeoxyribonuclease VII large subunit [Candidatus Saccharibacteria bacterium]|nr:exodeoxyribonuclease VII large subunit [Candidatus Saccharibacteria bacterium]